MDLDMDGNKLIPSLYDGLMCSEQPLLKSDKIRPWETAPGPRPCPNMGKNSNFLRGRS